MRLPIPSGKAGWGFLLSAIVLAVYVNCSLNGFVWDDEQFIQKNAYVSSWQHLPKLLTRNIVEGAGITSNLYRPLQGLTHFIDVRLWGFMPLGHHLTNILFHVAASAALFFLLCRLFPPAAAFFAAAFFSLHPLQSEAVAYLSGRGDTMAILFLCLGLLVFERSLLAALAFAALGVFSKEHMVLFPVFLFLFEYAQGKRIGWKRHAPFWVLSAGYTLLRLTVLNFQNTLNFYQTSNVFTENFSYRLFTYFTTAVKGWMLWLAPLDLHHERSWSVYTSLFQPKVAASLLILATMVFLVFILRKAHRAAAVGILWFFVATFPTSNLVILINAIFYDHWFILPGLGLTFLAGTLLAQGLGDPRWRRGVLIVSSLILIVLAAVTVRNNTVWRSPESLYTHILRFEPRSAKMNSNLGMALSDRGETDEAIRYYRRAIELSDEYPQTHHNLAMSYIALGREAEAETEFRRATVMDPNFYHSWEMLGVLHLMKGDLASAETELNKTLTLYPYAPRAYVGLADILLQRKDREGALALLERGIGFVPSEPRLRQMRDDIMKG